MVGGVCPGLSRWPYVITRVLVREAEGDLATEVDTDGGRGERTQEARLPDGHKPEAQHSWVYHLITHLLIPSLLHRLYQPLTHFIHVFLLSPHAETGPGRVRKHCSCPQRTNSFFFGAGRPLGYEGV